MLAMPAEEPTGGHLPCPAAVAPNNDVGWLGREPTPDEQEIVQWLKRRQLPKRICHVGIGAALLTKEFGSRVHQGLTKDGAEAEHARGLGLDVILCNKYDVPSYENRLSDPFDCIVDVNIRSYACCDRHFSDYMGRMLNALTVQGMLLTSVRGLEYLVPTGLPTLAHICPKWAIQNYGNVVVMRRHFVDRLRKGWSEFRGAARDSR